jgi:ribosome recycling factor
MEKKYLNELEEELKKSLDSLAKDFGKVRTGRASISLLDSVRVDYFGTPTPLNQLATIAIPESRLITIQPWDSKIIKDIEKAIQKADLGLAPSNDGKIVRVAIPPLTEERRKDMVKLVKKMVETSKISIRNHRRKLNDNLKVLKNDKELSEDDFFKAQEEVQRMTDEYIKKCDDLTKQKESELLEF